jgi:DNA-binding LacI/PurR family transcriptional regulator
LVLINRDDEQDGPLHINIDDAEAARAVLIAFLRAGCRRLAFANSAAGTPSLMAREEGFIAAAAAVGLSVTTERHSATSYDSGRYLAHRLLTRTERPDAVFCVTDLIACGFMDAARHDFGLRIPEDLCVAGFDDIEQSGWSSYALTTFAQPIEDIAAKAIAWLGGDSNGGPPRSSFIRLPAAMIWRGSVRRG